MIFPLLETELMPLTRRMIPVVLAVIIAMATLELIRRRKLREEYALLWLAASVVLWVFAIFPNALTRVSELLSTNYLTVLIMGVFLFLALNVLHFAVVISRQGDEIRKLAERVALLQREVKGQTEKKTGPAESGPEEKPKTGQG